MNYMKIEKASVSNGLGFRVVLWVSGCSLHCFGCQNPETWDYKAGKEFTEISRQKLFDALNHEWVKGITFSGGHPLEPMNLQEIVELIVEIKKEFPTKDIWLYTGYTLHYVDFEGASLFGRIISACDVIVDGKYIESERDITLPFRGSKNQRIIDVKKTLENKEITLLEVTNG